MSPLCKEVERIAVAAHADGRQMSRAIADHFDKSIEQAGLLMCRARRQGAAIPAIRPRKNAVKKIEVKVTNAATHLVCKCGDTFRVDRIIELQRHCVTQHKRVATRDERTPVAVCLLWFALAA